MPNIYRQDGQLKQINQRRNRINTSNTEWSTNLHPIEKRVKQLFILTALEDLVRREKAILDCL